MSKFTLYTTALMSGFAFNSTVSAHNAAAMDRSDSIDSGKAQLSFSSIKAISRDQGGLLGSGFCCADCRDLGRKLGR